MSEIIPLYVMILAVARTLDMVSMVFQLDVRVFMNTLPIVAREAFWMRPPIIAEIMIRTPGVLIHANLRLPGFSPV